MRIDNFSCTKQITELCKRLRTRVRDIQPWWLGGRAVASHSVESGRTLSQWIKSTVMDPLHKFVGTVICA